MSCRKSITLGGDGAGSEGGSRTAPTRRGRGLARAARFLDSAALRSECHVVRGMGDGSPRSRGHGRGRLFAGNVAGDHPAPVLTRAGSNLPSSRGKGFAGAVGGRGRGLLRPRDSSTPLRFARNDRCTGEIVSGREGWVPASARTREGGLLRRRDSSTPLRCAQNDMLFGGRGDGFPPPVFTG